MNKTLLSLIAGAALAALSACSHTTVLPAAQPAPATGSTTTTTQQQTNPSTTTTTQTQTTN